MIIHPLSTSSIHPLSTSSSTNPEPGHPPTLTIVIHQPSTSKSPSPTPHQIQTLTKPKQQTKKTYLGVAEHVNGPDDLLAEEVLDLHPLSAVGDGGGDRKVRVHQAEGVPEPLGHTAHHVLDVGAHLGGVDGSCVRVMVVLRARVN